MPARVYKNDPKELLAEGQQWIKNIRDSRFRHRVEMVNLVLQDATATFLSQGCKEDASTISRWVRIADGKGFAALCSKKIKGRPSRLGDEERAAIQSVLEEDNPKKYGYCVWDGRSLSDYIQKTFSVQLGIRQCQRLFHYLGFSLVRPQTFPSKNEDNKDARDSFKKDGRFDGRRFGNRGISRRGALSSDNFRYAQMGAQGPQVQGEICSRKKERSIQWIRHPIDRAAASDKAFSA